MTRNLTLLIVEDEESALKRLRRELDKIPNLNINVTAEFETCRDTIDWLRNNTAPDLIFMDIQLADGLSFEIFNQILLPCPVIFVTAYDKYALEAFRLNSLDYLLKPIDSEDLSRSIDRFFKTRDSLDQKSQFEQLQGVVRALNSQQYQRSYLVNFKHKMFLINTTQIAYFFLKQRLSYLMTDEGKSYPLDYSLDEIKSQIDPLLFYRANRQYLVAKFAIRQIEPYNKGTLALLVTPEPKEVITISREKVADFKLWANK